MLNRAVRIVMAIALSFCLTIGYAAIPMSGGAAYAATTERYVVLILDQSGSMSGTPMNVQKQAAIKFCEQMTDESSHNYVAFIGFGSDVTVGCDFTDDMSEIKACINNLYAYGQTNTSGALLQAKSLLDEIDESKINGQVIKSIVLCSDGLPCAGFWSNEGPFNYNDYYDYGYANYVYNTSESIRAKEVMVYSLGFFHDLSGSTLSFARKLMEEVSDEYYDVTDVNDLVFTFDEVADDVLENDNGSSNYANQVKTRKWRMLDEDGNRPTEDISFLWGMKKLDKGDPSRYDYDLAIAASLLCGGTYNESDPYSEMRFLGFEKNNQNKPFEDESVDRPYISFGMQKFTVDGIEKKAVCMSIRGTWVKKTINEFIQDVIGGANGFEEQGRSAYDSLANYCFVYGVELNDPNTILFVTGHSLGGATASRLAIELRERGINKCKSYIYTFASPNYKTGSYSNSDFKNIHMTWNEKDPVAALGGPGTSHLGQIIKFRKIGIAMEWSYHEMDRYIYRTVHSAGKFVHSLYSQKITYWFHKSWDRDVCLANPNKQLSSDNRLNSSNANELGLYYGFHCPVDVKVYASGNDIIADTTSGSSAFNDESGGYIIVDGDEKYVFVPYGLNYTLEIVGNGSGMMDVDVSEIGLYGETEAETSYNDVKIETGKKFLTTANCVSSVSDSHLMALNAQSVPEADVQSNGDEIKFTGSGTVGGNVLWALDASGKLRLSGSGSMPDMTSSESPWRSFAKNIKKVEIEDGVTHIGADAFSGLTGLSEVRIGATTSYIGANAFAGCTNLKSVIFLGDKPMIDASAFTGLNLNLYYYGENSSWSNTENLGSGVKLSGYCSIGSNGIVSNHSMESDVINPGCDELGHTIYSCRNCGYTYATYFKDSLTAHTFIRYLDDGNATCESDGTKTSKCEDCYQAYDTKKIDNSALGHSILHKIRSEATQDADGNIEYWYCERCDKCYSDAAAKNEIQQADTVIPKKGQSGGGGGGGGAAAPDTTEPTAEDKALVASVTDQINALPAEIGLDNLNQAKAAIDAYNALSEVQKSLVDAAVKTKIAAAEAKYKELTAPADKVKEKLKAIPEDVTKATKAQVTEAREAYDALADQLKALISEADVYRLEKAEVLIGSTEAAAKKPTIKKAKAVKGKKANVSWKKVSGADGYQISYSTSKKFTKKTTKSVSAKAGDSKKTLKKLKAGKKYYVRVKAYTKVYDPDKKAEVKVYSKWSKTKSLKAKK